MFRLTPRTTVAELIQAYPFLIEELPARYPRLAPLRNPAARAAMAPIATMERASGVAGVPVQDFMAAVAEIVRRHGGEPVEVEHPAAPPDRRGQVIRLKEIIRRLHEGGSVEEARREFQETVGSASPQEIAEMEQELIREGVPVQEIQRLCDLHVQVVRLGLDRQGPPEAPPGHPVHTYMAENRWIEDAANRFAELCRRFSVGAPPDAAHFARALDDLSRVDIHYTRKEHQLFPALEAHGFTGPSRVMWGLHDEIRTRLKTLRAAASQGDFAQVAAEGPAVARQITELIYKEERILFPAALSMLSHDEWVRMRQGDDAIGYLVEPAGPWPADRSTETTQTATEGEIPLSTGSLTLQQLDRLLVSLPVEISFVDDQDRVRFYSDHPNRIFPRSPGDIGRAVQNCHPQKSLHMVEAILKAFREGTRDRAQFWIDFKGRKILITYHAVRSPEGKYLGTMEVTQDITDIQSLQGERRLLQWE